MMEELSIITLAISTFRRSMMEMLFVILNVISKLSMFIILLFPIYLLVFYSLSILFKLLKLKNINAVKVVSFIVAVVIILTNINFLTSID